MFWRGRQFAVRQISDDVINDEKPDVLYLRDFKSDPSVGAQLFSTLHISTLVSRMYTTEEQLKEAVEPFGDFVAIGKPGERLPKPGAARMYASNDEWQDVVQEQMQKARLVIVRAGRGQGLLWELQKAQQLVEPGKLLILVLGMGKSKYRNFSKEAARIFGKAINEMEIKKNWGRISGFIYFSDDWQPRFLRLQIPYFRSKAHKPLKRQFIYTLKPIFEKHGLEWHEPPISKTTVTALSLLIIIFGGLFLLLLLTM